MKNRNPKNKSNITTKTPRHEEKAKAENSAGEENHRPTVLTARKTGQTEGAILTPYQLAVINDNSLRVAKVKSRRIGISWAYAYKAVRARYRRQNQIKRNLYYMAQDDVSATGFIDDCTWFIKSLFGRVADKYIDGWTDEKVGRDFTSHCIRTPGGVIESMSSNPRRLRGKSGDVYGDEIAFHDDASAMLKAAGPCIRWGGQVAFWSSHNGEGTLLHRIELNARKVAASLGVDIRAAHLVPWDTWAAKHHELGLRPLFNFHITTIEDAVREGLLDRINVRLATQGQKIWTPDAFLQDCQDEAEDDAAYQEEYMCVPVGSGRALLSYADIFACEHAGCAQPDTGLAGYTGQTCTVGVDVGREHDLTIIWVLEWLGDVGWTRQIHTLRGMSLPNQQRELEGILHGIKWSRCLIDKTGIGLGLYEYTEQRFGSRIQGVNYSSSAERDSVIVGVKQAFEDRTVRVPADCGRVRDALHGMQKKTIGTRITYHAPRNKSGHIDEFFGLGQAIECGRHGGSGGWIGTAAQRRTQNC